MPAAVRGNPLPPPVDMVHVAARNVEVNRQIKQIALKIFFLLATIVMTGIFASIIHPHAYTTWACASLALTVGAVPSFLEDINDIR